MTAVRATVVLLAELLFGITRPSTCCLCGHKAIGHRHLFDHMRERHTEVAR